MERMLIMVRRVCLFFFGLAAFFCSQPVSASECVKNLRWNDDPPFLMEIDDVSITGIDAMLVYEVLVRMDCSIVLQKMPWARALLSLEDGSIDIVTGAYRRPDREAYASFSDPYLVSPNLLYVRSAEVDRWQFKTLEEISDHDFLLGAQINVSYSEEFDHIKPSLVNKDRLVEASSRSSLWRMLAAGRVDGVIADQMTAQYELRKLGLDDRISNSGLKVSLDPVHIMFSKKTTSLEWIQHFNEKMKEVWSDGTAERLISSIVGRKSALASPYETTQ